MSNWKKERKIWRWLSSRLLNSETPIFLVGVITSLGILGLIVVVVYSTFTEDMYGITNQLSLNNYLEVFQSRIFSRAGINTLVLGIGTIIVNLFFAIPIVWLIHRTNVPYKNFYITLFFIHMLIPHFLKVMGWILLLSPKIGLINQLLRTFIPVETGPLDIYNMASIVILQGLGLTPVMFFMLSGAFQAIDPTFEEAGEVAGANKFRTIRRITFPLVLPAVVAAIIYNFMIAVSLYETAALLGTPKQIPVFSTVMFNYVFTQSGVPRYGVTGVYGVILLLPSLIALYYYQRMVSLGYRYATVTGKGYRSKMIDLGRMKYLGIGFIGFFFMIDIIVPILALAWASIVPYLQTPSVEALATVSIAGYREAIDLLIGGGVLGNTIKLVISVGIITTIMSLLISWIVLRTHLPGRYVMDSIMMLPHAVPRIAFAFSVLFLSLLFAKQIPIYGSLAAIILTHIIASLSFGTRAVNGALIQIHHDLEDAVQICGGSRLIAIRRLIIPLLGTTLFYVFFYTLLYSYREVTMALFLQSPRAIVMSVAIWSRWENFDTTTAAALGVIMVVCMGIFMSVVLRVFPQLAKREHYG